MFCIAGDQLMIPNYVVDDDGMMRIVESDPLVTRWVYDNRVGNTLVLNSKYRTMVTLHAVDYVPKVKIPRLHVNDDTLILSWIQRDGMQWMVLECMEIELTENPPIIGEVEDPYYRNYIQGRLAAGADVEALNQMDHPSGIPPQYTSYTLTQIKDFILNPGQS